MRRIFKNEKYQNDFQEKGYAIVHFLSNDEIDHLLNEIKNLRPDDNFDPDQNSFAPDAFHLSFFDTNVDYKRKADLLIRNTTEKKIENILENYRISQCNFSIKPAKKGEVAPHQDAFILQDFNEISLIFWCPLIDVNEKNGCLWGVEGSQKIIQFIANPAFSHYCSQFEDALKIKYSQPFRLQAGEAIIFDNSLIHWSSANTSNESRPAIQFGCIPKDSKPVHYHLDQSSNPNKFEVFELTRDFYLENNLNCFFERPQSLRSLGFVDVPNRNLTETEFVELLNRKRKIESKTNDQTNAGWRNLLQKLKQIFP